MDENHNEPVPVAAGATRDDEFDGTLLDSPTANFDRLALNAFKILFGSSVSVILSFIVNCSLYELAEDRYFSILFGVLIIVIAALFIVRVLMSSAGERDPKHMSIVMLTGIFLLMSGVLCFAIETHWSKIDIHIRCIFFGMLGMSIMFCFVYSRLEVWALGAFTMCFGHSHSAPLSKALYASMIGVIAIGFLDGVVFGITGTGVASRGLSSLQVEEVLCAIASAGMGAGWAYVVLIGRWGCDPHYTLLMDPHDGDLNATTIGDEQL
jgi:uncharacterized membrane protein YedE/YeeE